MCNAITQAQRGLLDTVQEQFFKDTSLKAHPTHSAQHNAEFLPATATVGSMCLAVGWDKTNTLRTMVSTFGFATGQYNARYETVERLRAFARYWKDPHRHLLIPARGFREGEAIFSFAKSGGVYPMVYLAGLRDEHNRFVVLTRPSVGLVKTYFPRQPITVPNSFALEYLSNVFDGDVMNELANYEVPISV